MTFLLLFAMRHVMEVMYVMILSRERRYEKNLEDPHYLPSGNGAFQLFVNTSLVQFGLLGSSPFFHSIIHGAETKSVSSSSGIARRLLSTAMPNGAARWTTQRALHKLSWPPGENSSCWLGLAHIIPANVRQLNFGS